jgi:hypothetical protein
MGMLLEFAQQRPILFFEERPLVELLLEDDDEDEDEDEDESSD